MAESSLMREALEQMLEKFQGGKPEAVLFTTFNFSSTFFESKVLPLLAGNSIEELKGSNLAIAGINSFLETTRTVVVCDRSALPDPQGELRYSLLPVGLEKGRFHPKMILMAGNLTTGKKGLWLSVGSGNISQSGWAHNREVVGVTPVAEKHRGELTLLLEWLLKQAEERISWIPCGPNEAPEFRVAEEGSTRDILREILAALKDHCIPDARASDAPELHLALPAAIRGAERSLISALAGKAGWDSVTVVSPYWGEVPGLMREFGAAHCRFVPAVRRDGLYGFPLESVQGDPLLNGKYSFLKFIEDKTPLFTHAKALMLNRSGENVLCIGSANFTVAAMLHGTGRLANVEAMLRYRFAGTDPLKNLLGTLDTSMISGPENDPEDEGAPQLPPFAAEVVCDWQTKRFYCRFTLYEGAKLTALSMEVAGKHSLLHCSEAKEQRQEVAFVGKQPVRNFLVRYALKSGEHFLYQGVVTQVNAQDDELGYLPPPRLGRIIELLRGLDPSLSSRELRRRTRGAGTTDDDSDDQANQPFNFFDFFQGTYRMRAFYGKLAELDPFSRSAPQGFPQLYRAVTLQPVVTDEQKIRQYVQLCELLTTVKALRPPEKRQGRPDQGKVQDLESRLESDVKDAEAVVLRLLESSPSFATMFGHVSRAGKVPLFLKWFRQELMEGCHVA